MPEMMPGDAGWAESALACLWSAGQSDDWRQLSDRVLRAENVDVCEACAGPIVPGEWMRQEVAVRKGEVRTFRYCQACCHAMTLWYEVPGKLEERYTMGTARRRRPPNDPAARKR